MLRSAAFIALFVCASALAQMQPFEMVWRVEDRNVQADVSFLLDAPAGRHGVVQVRSGHFYRPDGKRLRLWGVNFSMAANAPRKEDASYIAAHLARLGVNCVRVHHFDHPSPRGILAAGRDDTHELDPEQLDRFDFFVSELKKRGVYVNINLNVARLYKPGDGVREYDQLGYGKAATLFDERLIELQQDYARRLLTHRNPYTNSEYRTEPAVVTVEIVNENSVIESWKAGRLQGKGKGASPESTWVDIPASYERDLTRKYHEWLGKRVAPAEFAKLRSEAGDPVPRMVPADFSKASPLRFHTEAAFYMDIEDRFYQRMYKFLKEMVGVAAPVVGNSVHNAGISPYPLLPALSRLDMVDTHTYWQHPRYLYEAGKRRFEIQNSAMVNAPARSSVMNLSRAAVSGKPFSVSEVNHPYPSEYSAEGIPILAAYAAFHDWDAIYWYTFEHAGSADWTPKAPGFFDLRQDPVKISQLAAGALIFLRGDVAPAKRTIERSYTQEQVFESLRLPGSEAPFFTPGFPPLTALTHAVRVASLSRPQRASWPQVSGGDIVSDTGQLRWSVASGRGVVSVDTGLSQALIGYLSAQPRALRNLSAEVRNEFCAITLSSLDGKPLAQASRMLLTTGARVGATGMTWNEKRTSTVDPGKAPILMEPVAGTITLSGLSGSVRVEVVPLDGAGRSASAPIAATRAASAWKFPVGGSATPWYLIHVQR
jgi:hypothetical protein